MGTDLFGTKMKTMARSTNLEILDKEFNFATSEDLAKVCEIVHQRVMLSHLKSDMWKDHHDETIFQFLVNPLQQILVIYVDSEQELHCETEMPSEPVEELAYFLKTDDSEQITMNNLRSALQYGTIKPNYLENLLMTASKIYAPILLNNKTWPDCVKDDFTSEHHKFLGNMTDYRYQLSGHKVLYVPQEGQNVPVEVAAEDKELVQRLEGVVIRWIHQIKEALTAISSWDQIETSGVLDEVQFWKQRCDNLTSISEQIENPEVAHISSILNEAKSPCHQQFSKLSKEIQETLSQAASNLKFMSLLKEPCEKLTTSPLKDIPAQIRNIVHLIRVIWLHSPQYGVDADISGLFRKLNNELIRRCSQEICIERLFEMYAVSTKKALLESVECCQEYKRVYRTVSNVHKKFSPFAWSLDEEEIFTSLDAFIQRCKDVIEVCDCEMQFGRWQDGEQIPIPHFSGLRGLDITKSLKEIEDRFMHALSTFTAAKEFVLDVWSTAWHGHYTLFRSQIQDLERTVLNAISYGFDTVNTVTDGLEILQAFSSMAEREEVSRGLIKWVGELYSMMHKELEKVELEHFNKNVHLRPLDPYYGGTALWVNSLLRRIEIQMEQLKNAEWLPTIGVEEDMFTKYKQVSLWLKDSMRSLYNEWSQSVKKEPLRKLNVPLACRSPIQPEMLDINFDRSLYKLLQEIDYFEQLNFDPPHFLRDVVKKKDDLLVLRENVMVIVRAYNRILSVLSPEEKGLFNKKIRFLDRNLNPGLTRFTWLAPNVVKMYVADCKKCCTQIEALIKKYKSSNSAVSMLLQDLKAVVLVRVDDSTTCIHTEFKTEQENFRLIQYQEIIRKYVGIFEILRSLHHCFEKDGPEIYAYWVRYIQRIDDFMGEALKTVVRTSLHALDQAINGDDKLDINTFINVEIVLSGEKITMVPSVEELVLLFESITKNVIDCVSDIDRLTSVLTEFKDKPAFKQLIMEDEDCCQIRNNIAKGLHKLHTEAENHFKHWEQYENTWKVDKDAFIEKYRHKDPTAETYDHDIEKFVELHQAALKEERIVSIQFLCADTIQTKNSIQAHCIEWQKRLITLLHSVTTECFRILHDSLESYIESLQKPLETVEDLQDCMKLYASLKESKDEIILQRDPLMDKVHLLEKREVSLEPDLLTLITSVELKLQEFEKLMEKIEARLLKSKETFKSKLMHSATDHQNEISAYLKQFLIDGPFSGDLSYRQALLAIDAIQEHINELEKKQNALFEKLNIINVHLAPSQELGTLKQITRTLKDVWLLVKEWEENSKVWEEIPFTELLLPDICRKVDDMYPRLHTVISDLDKEWSVVESLESNLRRFKVMLPIVGNLKTPAITIRHWEHIQNILGKTFDYTASNFNINAMSSLGFHKFGHEIAEIAQAAKEEAEIEKKIAEIYEKWKNQTLTLTFIQNVYYLRKIDEIFELVDENMMSLTALKNLYHAKPFAKEIDDLQCTLSLMKDCLERIVDVQKKCHHLQNIFIAGDIRWQLPSESEFFGMLNDKWQKVSSIFHEEKTVLCVTEFPGLIDEIVTILGEFEHLESNLNAFLETKRFVFPRFYFISNTDMLEILGKPSHPGAVQLHLKKCFDGIRRIRFDVSKTSEGNRIALGMLSPDGQYVRFSSPVKIEGTIEYWLIDIEKAMKVTLKKQLSQCLRAYRKHLTSSEELDAKYKAWLKAWPGQLCILTSQIRWTADCLRSLNAAQEGNAKSPLKGLKKKQEKLLNSLVTAMKESMSSSMRMKAISMIIIEVHCRDIIDRLLKSTICDSSSFDWITQLQFYYNKETEICTIKLMKASFEYQFEYLGNYYHIITTPLTERCYIALTTALHLFRGAVLKGPAGTGKTETIRSLAKTLGNYYISINCHGSFNYNSLRMLLSGVAQIGAWCSIDQLHMIDTEVLSVTAHYIQSIFMALSLSEDKFIMEGQNICLKGNCAIFITIHPLDSTYNISSCELPDNMKAMFRPVAMIIPDSTYIAEIMLFINGFTNAKVSARKLCALYETSVQQLSQQNHYDFSLRSLIATLQFAMSFKTDTSSYTEDQILLLAIIRMNAGKLLPADRVPFNRIVQELFPVVLPTFTSLKLEEAIIATIKEMNLKEEASTINHALQLHQAKKMNHCVMLVGAPASGKTVAWKILQLAYKRLKNEAAPGFNFVKEFCINPKVLTNSELFGKIDETGKWVDGIVSWILRQSCTDTKHYETWIIFDGPIDAVWIESMNSAMDDDKVMTLVNGERIYLTQQVSLLFEVDSLDHASPSSISRCGFVYFDYNDLGWQPYAHCWLEHYDEYIKNELGQLFSQYIPRILNFKKENCKEIIPVTELNGVISLCKLLGSFIAAFKKGTSANPVPSKLLKLWFFFAVTWTVCAAVDDAGRKKIDNLIRELEYSYPKDDIVYDYFVDSNSISWLPWIEKLQDRDWKYNPSVPYFKMIVPNADNVKYCYFISRMIEINQPVLLLGPQGCGKSSIMKLALNDQDPTKYSVLMANLSTKTEVQDIKNIINSQLIKKAKELYIPTDGKKLLAFLDNVNLPEKDAFGYQPSLELICTLMTYGYWYSTSLLEKQCIQDTLIISAMDFIGTGRRPLPQRLQHKFSLINMTFPQKPEIFAIFKPVVTYKLSDFVEEVKVAGTSLLQATIDLCQTVNKKLLPTPSRLHYIFNMKNIAKVVEGLLYANKDYVDNTQNICRLWIHECLREFSDSLITESDKDWFLDAINSSLGSSFNQTISSLCPGKALPTFFSHMNMLKIYEDIERLDYLEEYLNHHLQEYNRQEDIAPLDLFLFKDAIQHIVHICRVLDRPNGNLLLLGIGGIGKQSLSKLATYVCGYTRFEMQIIDEYTKKEFHEDLKTLLVDTGVHKKPTTFLVLDSHLLDEQFLDAISDILRNGEVTNLFRENEKEEIFSTLSEILMIRKTETKEYLNQTFTENVKTYLHLIISMNPYRRNFRMLRSHSAILQCTTTKWISQWPKEAFISIATRKLSSIDFGQVKTQEPIMELFASCHGIVEKCSHKVFHETKRYIYVPPTSFLLLIDTYKKFLLEKKNAFSSEIKKLSGGLNKIDETSSMVEIMTAELNKSQEQVKSCLKECNEFRMNIVQQKQDADHQQKWITTKSERVAEEEVQCKKMADVALEELKAALPALERAREALGTLNKKDLGEVRSYTKPPLLVEKVMESIMIFKGLEPSWTEAKKQLGDPNFIDGLKNFDADNIPDRILGKVARYVNHEDFQPATVGKVSKAAESFCYWVRATENYARISRMVEPKKKKLRAAEETLASKQAELQEARERLEEINTRIKNLKEQYDEKLTQKEELQAQANDLETKLMKTKKLVEGLLAERLRWHANLEEKKESLKFVAGDAFLAAAFLSYLGPFPLEYRKEIISQWTKLIQPSELSCSADFEISEYITIPKALLCWNEAGLRTDKYSIENAVLILSAIQWPLIIDPHQQAVRWIKNLEENKDLIVLDVHHHNLYELIVDAIQKGIPVILDNFEESLHPALDPLLCRDIISSAVGWDINIFGKHIAFGDHFKLYIATKSGNPNISSEIYSRTMVVNFGMTQQGLEDQLLAITVKNERPNLEEQKAKLVASIAEEKQKLEDLNTKILSMLNSVQGELLEDELLIEALQTAKDTSQDIAEQVQSSEKTEKKIETAREGYRPYAARGAVLFLVLNDLSQLEPMYQFSLDSYIELFIMSIRKSPRDMRLKGRIQKLNDYHTYLVYRYANHALFERHKLLLSFIMCVKLMESVEGLNKDDFNFFLKDALVHDKKNQTVNPSPEWLTERMWDHITELDRLSTFRGIVTSLDEINEQWFTWFNETEPENSPLPGEWERRCRRIQKLNLVKSLRPDRIIHSVTDFVVTYIGSKFAEPPLLDINFAMEFSTPDTPFIFILSPGTDPVAVLQQHISTQAPKLYLQVLPIGQIGLAVAKQFIIDAANVGNWVLLPNCHLHLQWIPELDQLLEDLKVTKIHPYFRLWLSSISHQNFPKSFLQKSVKIATEFPKGIRNNMTRMYMGYSEEQLSKCEKNENYSKLLFCLTFFHNILTERKCFKNIGWNVTYKFNDTDLKICEYVLESYMEKENMPWHILKYFIGDIIYGGYIGNEWDKRLMQVYSDEFFCEALLTEPSFKLSPSPFHWVPPAGNRTSYLEHIKRMSIIDGPEVFGLHSNSSITTQIDNSRMLFRDLLCLQSSVSSSQKENEEAEVLKMCNRIMEKLPNFIAKDIVEKYLEENSSPINICLMHEVERYNKLLEIVKDTLSALKDSLEGMQVMSTEAEEVFNVIADARVPEQWKKIYPSLKKLGSWIDDLIARISHFDRWVMTNMAPVKFWLSAFIFPRGFLIAVLQEYSQSKKISIDSLTWDFIVSTREEGSIIELPERGIYVTGFYIEGAAWDRRNCCLIEATPMRLTCPLPVVNFKPVEHKKKKGKDFYTCPCYYYPDRKGTPQFPSFIIAIDVKSGSMKSQHWVKRGTAFIMSLDT